MVSTNYSNNNNNQSLFFDNRFDNSNSNCSIIIFDDQSPKLRKLQKRLNIKWSIRPHQNYTTITLKKLLRIFLKHLPSPPIQLTNKIRKFTSHR